MSEFKKFQTIENTDQLGVVSLAIRPNQASKFGEGNLSGKDLQRRFDRLANTIVKEYNNLVRILGNAFSKDSNGNPLDTALSYIAWRVITDPLTEEQHTESLADFMQYLKDGTLAYELYVSDPTDGEKENIDTLNSVILKINNIITAALGNIENSFSILKNFIGYGEDKETIPDTYYSKAAQIEWAKSLSLELSELNQYINTLKTYISYDEKKSLITILDDTFVSGAELVTELNAYLKSDRFESFIKSENSSYESLASAILEAVDKAIESANDRYIHKFTAFDTVFDIKNSAVSAIEEKGYQTATDVESKLSSHSYDKEYIDEQFKKYALKSDITGLYSLQGSVETLPTSGVKVGYVYDVLSETTYNGKKYAAGTNFACIKINEDGSYVWDPMTQNYDTSELIKKSEVVNALDENAIDLPLSAAMGKLLNEKFSGFVPAMKDTDKNWNRVYGMDTNGNIKVYRLSSTTAFSETVAFRGPDKKIVAHDHVKDISPSYYVSSKELAEALDTLRDEITYKAITITSFTVVGTKTFEKGQSVNSVSLTWTTNTTPSTQKLDGSDVSGNSVSVNGPWSSYKSWTLSVTDKKGASSSSVTSISFCNRVYFGVSSVTSITNDIIKSFNNELRNNKAVSFSVEAKEGEYVYYCQPTSYGKCSFTDTDTQFPYGFEDPETISFTNAYGYTEDYYVYRSSFAIQGLANIKIT